MDFKIEAVQDMFYKRSAKEEDKFFHHSKMSLRRFTAGVEARGWEAACFGQPRAVLCHCLLQKHGRDSPCQSCGHPALLTCFSFSPVCTPCPPWHNLSFLFGWFALAIGWQSCDGSMCKGLSGWCAGGELDSGRTEKLQSVLGNGKLKIWGTIWGSAVSKL